MNMMLDDLLPLVEKGKDSVFRLRFGEVVGIDGSTLVIAAKAGGTVYASTYVYCEVGDTVCYVADGANCVAFAAKDAARLEQELSQAGVAYEAGDGIKIEDRVISADVTMKTIDGVRADTIPVAFIEAL